MNKHLHRIIFNANRGQLMVVSEAASASGKSAGGERMGASSAGSAGSAAGATSRAPGVALHPLKLATMVMLSLLVWTAPMLPAAHAQIIANPNAPGNQRPTILQTAIGVTQVNIQTPSAAGVSRNLYIQFDVQQKGAILNNSRTTVQTQLGGFQQGNPWLATGPARVILNEISSSNPSQLMGPIEVGGQRAEVVIANPAGINVDGAGFINASRVTLTTGTPVMSGAS